MKPNKQLTALIEKEFDTKVKELNDLSVALHTKIYQGTTTKTETEESDSTVVDFGMKIFRGNEIFTVTDWGNVRKVVYQIAQKYAKEERKRVIEEIIQMIVDDDEKYISEEVRRARNRMKHQIVNQMKNERGIYD